MMDHSENTLNAAIKSLRDTVAPAIDRNDPQVEEQLRLTIDFLSFLQTRIYDIHARQRYELVCQVAVARSLLSDAATLGPEVGERLALALSHAEATHAAADSHTDDLRAASQQLWGAVRGVVRSARTAPQEVRDRIGEQVLAGVAPLVELESAWYVPFGFEPAPDSVPDLAALLAGSTVSESR